MSISGISQLLLTWFWWNFTGRFLGTSRADSNCHSDICTGNICPPLEICRCSLYSLSWFLKRFFAYQIKGVHSTDSYDFQNVFFAYQIKGVLICLLKKKIEQDKFKVAFFNNQRWVFGVLKVIIFQVINHTLLQKVEYLLNEYSDLYKS